MAESCISWIIDELFFENKYRLVPELHGKRDYLGIQKAQYLPAWFTVISC